MEHRDDPRRHRRAFGHVLQTWYERRGMSLRRLGDLVPCGFALIHRAAQGRDWPAPWFLVRADWCLGADGRLIEAFVECWLREELERPAGGEATRPATRHHGDHRLLLDPEEVAIRVADLSVRIAAAVASWTPEMKRRAFLRWSGFGAASLPVAIAAGGLEGMEHLVLGTHHGGRAETVAAEQCREIIGMCRRLDDMGMSAAVLQVGRRTLARVDELVRDCTSAAARRPLTLLVGELSQIVGYAAAGLGDRETAKRFTDRAITAADEAGSTDLHAYTMSLNLVGAELECRPGWDLAATATAATAAQDWARLSGNPAVLSEAHGVAALVQARAGRQSAALRALEDAERHLERSTPEERPTWLYWYDPAVLLERRGACLLDLHRAGRPGPSGIDETVASLHGSLATLSGGYPRERAWRQLHLADAYWGHGQREESIRQASDALVLAAGMEWGRIRERLGDFNRRVEEDPLPAARDFGDRFRTLVRS
ncbi:MAG: hypothetical protein JWM18_4926 [Chloroflexi bacterium]|nr:hypothetical protein [Chloroflexota bacterium]